MNATEQHFLYLEWCKQTQILFTHLVVKRTVINAPIKEEEKQFLKELFHFFQLHVAALLSYSLSVGTLHCFYFHAILCNFEDHH